MRSIIQFGDHSPYDRLKGGQVDRRDLPNPPVVKPLVFMPQHVAYPNDGSPGGFVIFGQHVLRECLCGVRARSIARR